MGNTRNTGYLQNIVQYDASNNITLPARLAVTSTVAINNTTPYDTTQFSLDVNGGLIVKNVGKTAQIALINANPASGGNAGFVIHTVGGTSTSSYADIQGYYGTSIAGGTVIRLNPQGGNVLVGSLAGTGSRMVVADSTGVLSTQAIITLGDLSGTPTSRTLTINGVTYDLTANRSWSALPVGGVAGDILAKVDGTDYNATWIPNYTSQVQHQVKLGATMTAGTAVYVSGSTGNSGTNMIVSKASNATEATSSKTLGLIATGGATNDIVFVVTEGLLAGLDTSTATAGDPVWLGVNGQLIFGLLNKPTAPAHLVFIGVVTRVQQNNGEIFVKVQNGFELDELHDLSVKNASDGDMIKYVASTGLWTKIAASTTNIVEGTNLYYTDARVGTYLTANLYATQTYVNTAVSNLVDAAPGTLDTLNELAAALGDDPNFATTVATSIGTKVPNTRTITINGTAYDLSADRSWSITSMIYPSAGIAVSTGSAWGTSITDNSTNWNTAYGWGNHASAGYITSSATSLSLTGNLTVSSGNTSGGGIILADDGDIVDLNDSYCSMRFSGGVRIFSANRGGTAVITLANSGAITATGNISAANFSGSSSGTNTGDQTNISGYAQSLYSPNGASVVAANSAMPGTGQSFIHTLALGPSDNDGHILGMTWAGTTSVYGAQIWLDTDPTKRMAIRGRSAGGVWTSWAEVLTDSNFTSYSPTLTGGSASGTWGISITGTSEYANQLKWYGAGASVTDANTFQKGIISNYYGGGAISNVPEATYGSLYNFGGYDASSLALQLYSAVNHNSTSSTRTLYFRMGNNLGFQNDWKTLIDNTSIGSQSVNYATTAGTLSSNATINGLNFGGVLALTASGASTGNTTGARLSESYGPIWNLSNSSTWHHQVINGSYLCGISAGGGNYGGGNYYGTGDVTAYYSDDRLKSKVSNITDAIEKIKSLEGFVYIENDLARSFGYTNEREQAGVSAQQIQAVLPQAVSLAPFDMQGVPETGEIISKTGENYLTVKYDRIVPLLIEGIKEQQTQIESQKTEIEELKDLVQQLINR
jgi:hypothetical protein